MIIFFDVIIVCNWADDGDCNDDDHEKNNSDDDSSCSFSDIQLDNILSAFAQTQRDAESQEFSKPLSDKQTFNHALYLAILNPEPLLAQVKSKTSRTGRGSQFLNTSDIASF